MLAGLKEKHGVFLNRLPYVHGVLKINTTKSLFPNRACRFKPLMFLDFIERYQTKHQCRFFFYGDAVSAQHVVVRYPQFYLVTLSLRIIMSYYVFSYQTSNFYLALSMGYSLFIYTNDLTNVPLTNCSAWVLWPSCLETSSLK